MVKKIKMEIVEISCYKEIEEFWKFRLIKGILDPQVPLSQQLIQQAVQKALSTNFNKVDSGGRVRSEEEKRFKSIIGCLSELCMFCILKYFSRSLNKDKTSSRVEIQLDNSSTSLDQIDIFIKKYLPDRSVKHYTFELRSSLPFKDIKSTICGNFDVLGPYYNAIKKSEKSKDFYGRLLFDLETKKYPQYYIYNNNRIDYRATTTNILKNVYFDQNYRLIHPLILYFVGGATHSMMVDPSISYYGKMSNDTFQNEQGWFRKIKIYKALDAISFLSLVLEVGDTELIGQK
jgi:hypothetical protein